MIVAAGNDHRRKRQWICWGWTEGQQVPWANRWVCHIRRRYQKCAGDGLSELFCCLNNYLATNRMADEYNRFFGAMHCCYQVGFPVFKNRFVPIAHFHKLCRRQAVCPAALPMVLACAFVARDNENICIFGFHSAQMGFCGAVVNHRKLTNAEFKG